MLRLVDVTDDGAWVRRRVDVADLPPRVWDRRVDALVDARLVAAIDGQLDVVHEVVFPAWPQMVAWLDEARADLVLERDLRAAARVWDAAGSQRRRTSLRGGRLQAATDSVGTIRRPRHRHSWLRVHRGQPEGRRPRRRWRCVSSCERERRGRRRLRAALAVAPALLLVGALTGGILAVRNSRHADEQREQPTRRLPTPAPPPTSPTSGGRMTQTLRLVAESRGNLDRDLPLSLLLAVEANRGTDTAEAPEARCSMRIESQHVIRACDPRQCVVRSPICRR